MRAAQSGAAAFDVPTLNHEFGAHFFQGAEMEIHRPAADGAPTGQGDRGPAESGQQGTKTEHRGPHGADQVIGGFMMQVTVGPDGQGRAALLHFAAQKLQQVDRGLNVP